MMKSALVSLLFLSKQSLSSGWDYHDMKAWSDDFSMCDNEDQSPIDIQSNDAIYDDEICNAFFDWDIEYDITDFKVMNNGHSIVLQPVQESSIDPDFELESTLIDSEGTEYQTLSLAENTIAKFPNYFKPENSPHEEFCLHSLHFHWGLDDETGSEHFINGHQYALEVHFVHHSCEHASLGTTLSQFTSERNVSEMEDADEDAHQLGVVGFFFDVVEDDEYINPAFDALLDDIIINSVKLPGHSETIVHDFNLKDLIPEDYYHDGYYAYQGSLTTPPCTDIVRWHVMQSRGKISVSQMEKFRELKTIEHEEETQIAPNYREIQSNVNAVYGCMDAPIEEEESSTARIIVWIIAVIACITPCIMAFVCCRKAKRDASHQGNVANKQSAHQSHATNTKH